MLAKMIVYNWMADFALHVPASLQTEKGIAYFKMHNDGNFYISIITYKNVQPHFDKQTH